MKGEEVLEFLERIERHNTYTYTKLRDAGIFLSLVNSIRPSEEYEKITPESLKRRSPELFIQLHNILVENRMKDLC